MLQVLTLTWIAVAGEDLELLLRWHQSTIEAIRSLRCDVEIRWTHPSNPQRRELPDFDPLRGRYARQGSLIRHDQFLSANTQTSVYKDGKCYTFSIPSTGQTQITSTHQKRSFLNVERYAGLILDYPLNNGYYSVPELVRRAKPVRGVQARGELVDIDADFPVPNHPAVWKSRITLDKSLGCMVVEVSDVSGTSRRTVRMLDFQEFAGGLRFPTKVEGIIEVNGKVNTIMTMRLSDVRINEPIPLSEFSVNFQHGTIVRDLIRQKEYQVDDRGARISEEKDAPIYTVEVGGGGGGGERPQGGPSEVESDDWAWLRWGGALALFVLVTVLAWRHWRR